MGLTIQVGESQRPRPLAQNARRTGHPHISLFTLLHAESVLSRDGITSWDREGGFIVRHEKIGVMRTTVAVVFLGLVYILGIYVKITGMGQR